MKHRHWVVLYDVRDPKRLQRAAAICLQFGVRVQYSAYEVEGPYEVVRRLRQAVLEVLAPEDALAIFPVCEADWQKRIKLGPGPFQENVAGFQVW